MAWLREKTKKERAATGIKYGFCAFPMGCLYLAYLYAQATSVQQGGTQVPSWFYVFLAVSLVVFFAAGFGAGYSEIQTPE